jgi:hypothetical protein
MNALLDGMLWGVGVFVVAIIFGFIAAVVRGIRNRGRQ